MATSSRVAALIGVKSIGQGRDDPSSPPFGWRVAITLLRITKMQIDHFPLRRVSRACTLCLPLPLPTFNAALDRVSHDFAYLRDSSALASSCILINKNNRTHFKTNLMLDGFFVAFLSRKLMKDSHSFLISLYEWLASSYVEIC
jgi:hypothetical protein